jgi:hypothetical protein
MFGKQGEGRQWVKYIEEYPNQGEVAWYWGINSNDKYRRITNARGVKITPDSECNRLEIG